MAAMARHWLGIQVEVAVEKCLCSLPEIRGIDSAIVGRGVEFLPPLSKEPTCYLVVVATTSIGRYISAQLAAKDIPNRMFL